MAWLGTWKYRRKITVDNTNVDSDLPHFPVPIVFGSSVGQDNQDLSGIFTELESNSKKIAITKSDGTTQIYGEIEHWDDNTEQVLTPNTTRDLGSTDGGLGGLTAYGSPVDNGTYYTFDGATNGLSNTTYLGSTSTEVCWAKVRIHNKTKGTAQIIWKDGGDYNGIAVGIDASGNLGLFGRSSTVLSSLSIPSTDYENDVWYDIYFTRQEIYIFNSGTMDLVASKKGAGVSSSDGTGSECVGHADLQSPITGVSGTNFEFFEGDIDFVKVFTSPNLTIPIVRAVIRVSKDDLTISSGNESYMYIYYDSTQEDNTTYIGDVGDTPAQSVWDSNFKAVYHMAQDPSGTAPQLLDSTVNSIDGTSMGSMTSADLVEGSIGKAIDFDGTDDYFTTANVSDGLDITDILTLEAFVYTKFTGAISATQYFMCRQEHPSDVDSYGFFINSSSRLQLGSSGGNIQGPIVTFANQEYYFAGTYDDSLVGKLFQDGVSQSLYINNYDAMAGGANSFLIGAHSPTISNLNGYIREVRISNTVRSDAWIKTTQYAEKDDLLTYGTEEEVLLSAVDTPVMAPTAGDYNPTQTITLTSANADSIYYTVDGSDPDNTDTLYSTPIPMFDGTLKAIGVSSTLDDSEIASETYTFSLVPVKFHQPKRIISQGVYRRQVYTAPTTRFGMFEYTYIAPPADPYPTKTFEEPYTIFERSVRFSIEEPYPLANIINNPIEELYFISLPINNLFNEIYGLKLGISIVQYYSDTPILKVLINEYYNDTYFLKCKIIEEYWDVLNPKKIVNEPYSGVFSPGINISMYYGDKPVVLSDKILRYNEATKNSKIIEENYSDYPVKIKITEEEYNDKAVLKRRYIESYTSSIFSKKVISQIWNIFPSVMLEIEETYKIITGDSAIKDFSEIYDFYILNKVSKQYEERYYMVSNSSLIKNITANVFVNGIFVDIIGINIDSGIDKYAILGSLTLASEADYINCPLLGEVECVLNDYSFKFFIENRGKQIANEGTSYTVSMVSPTAKLDSPYSKTMVLSFNNGLYASEIVQQMADYKNIIVDWQLDVDWIIPSYAISANGETPLTVIKKIVNAVGGIVQTKPNGDMAIISQYPISPKDFEIEEPTVIFSSETDIISMEDSIEINDGTNAFVITDQGTSGAEIKLEEINISDTEKLVRGFRIPFADGPFDLVTSGGDFISINKTIGFITAVIPVDFNTSDNSEEWEYIEFIDWVGKTQYPIYEVDGVSIIEWEWLSEDLGSFQISENGTLTCTSKIGKSESLLRIKYNTKYWEWVVTGPESRHAQLYVPELIT